MKRAVPLVLACAAICTVGGVLMAQPGAPQAPPDQAVLVLRVPADATVSIGEQVFKQTGPERSLITPTLKPGKSYSYELFVRWKDKGQEMVIRRTVEFQAGQFKFVDLTKAEPASKDVAKKVTDKAADKKETKKVTDKAVDKKDTEKRDADKKSDKKDGEKKSAGVWTDPKDPKLPVDYTFQGEYVFSSAKDTIGCQVIALGGGAFQAVVLQGGLPGQGWDGKNKSLMDGKLEDADIQLKNGSSLKKKVTFVSASGKRSYLAKAPTEFSATAKFPPTGQRDLIGSADGRGVFIQEEGGKESYGLKKVTRQSPTLGQKPPPGATILFDGTSADEWQAGRLDKTSGLLNTDGHDITTKRRFNNYTVHVEFLLPFRPDARGQGRGNSGFYQVSQYEVQILDSFGLEGKNDECGGIYSKIAPSVNACLPPLQWQTYDIDFTNAVPDPSDSKKPAKKSRITCKLNGIVIHDNVEIPGPTGGAWGQPEGTPGPLILQGHGNPLQFRNIWIVEKK